ncbi:MAG: N-formylglutamate amidohydrolase [Patescibacteria group bacterium]
MRLERTGGQYSMKDILKSEGPNPNLYQTTLENLVYTVSPFVPPNVIITVPHDGLYERELSLSDLSPRQSGVKVRDVGVWPIVWDLLTKHQTPVGVVRGLVPRTHVDYNRNAIEAYENPLFSETHKYYHAMISGMLNAADPSQRKSVGRLLIDLHGFTRQPDQVGLPEGGYDLILGTQHGRTAQEDVSRRFGDFFMNRGYKVYIPEEVEKDGEMYEGGFTIGQYAKYMDCIQVEIARKYRDSEQGRDIGPRLSQDLNEFIASIS